MVVAAGTASLAGSDLRPEGEEQNPDTGQSHEHTPEAQVRQTGFLYVYTQALV